MSARRTVLVVGGAGYVGSHMTWLLAQRGIQVIVLDDLSNGHADAVHGGELIRGDMADRGLLAKIFSAYKVDAVMHFASFIQVGESVQHPARYYHNNVIKTLGLLDAMRDHGVLRFIFSSTAAVFGEPDYVPIDERHPLKPINPYGRSKLVVEQILADYERAYGLSSVCLRYFNAAGAHPEGLMGERHEPETHLIPLMLQAASGRRSSINVFGKDYDTPDGTCIRDYIHVMDLAEAHWLALDRLMQGGQSSALNLGNGNGYSVQEVLDIAQLVTQVRIPVEYHPRRAGDPARLVADSSSARRELGWAPHYPDLQTIIEHAWNWERAGLLRLQD